MTLRGGGKMAAYVSREAKRLGVRVVHLAPRAAVRNGAVGIMLMMRARAEANSGGCRAEKS